MQIRNACAADAPFIAALYNPYILATTISFEEQPVTPADIAARIADVHAAGLPWLVAEENGELRGYAYATRWRVRHAYRFSVESSVYVRQGLARQGIGSALYAALLDSLADSGVHLVIGGIALPNDASIAMHEKMGFEKAAHFKEVGFKLGAWRDVGYWQKILDSSA